MNDTLHVAKVSIRERHYPDMDEPIEYEKFHTVNALNEEEAKEKIENFYEKNNENYGTTRSVMSIEFFEHID